MRLNAYLTFDGNCAEAFRFYEQCLGGRIEMMMTYGDGPMAEQTPPEKRDNVMHVRLAVGDQVLMAADAPPQFRTQMQGFSVSISVDEPDEAERIYKALGEGGTVKMALQETFWAQRFAMLIDRCGTPWMISCERPD
jgi:PhnB protein